MDRYFSHVMMRHVRSRDDLVIGQKMFQGCHMTATALKKIRPFGVNCKPTLGNRTMAQKSFNLQPCNTHILLVFPPWLRLIAIINYMIFSPPSAHHKLMLVFDFRMPIRGGGGQSRELLSPCPSNKTSMCLKHKKTGCGYHSTALLEILWLQSYTF